MPLSDISISKENDACIALLKEKGYFDDDKSAARFATSYALRTISLNEYLPLEEYKGNYTNNKWHIQDFDGDRFFRSLIKLYFEGITDEDYALRSVISIGLDAIYKKASSNKDWTIIDFI